MGHETIGLFFFVQDFLCRLSHLEDHAHLCFAVCGCDGGAFEADDSNAPSFAQLYVQVLRDLRRVCAVVTCIPRLQSRSASQTRPVGQIGFRSIGDTANVDRPRIARAVENYWRIRTPSARERHPRTVERQHERWDGACGCRVGRPFQEVLSSRLREDVIEHAGDDDRALCMNR